MGTKSLNEKRSDTIQRILDAATAVFSELGFTGARVDEIADRAGVNKATIYYHIGDKQALYAEVLHRTLGGGAEALLSRLELEASPKDKLKRYIRQIIGTVERNPQVPPIVMREVASGGENFPEVVVEDITKIVGALSGILKDGARVGEFIETNPFIIHMMVLGCVLFYKNMQAIKAKHADFPDSLNKLDQGMETDYAGEIEKLILKAVKA